MEVHTPPGAFGAAEIVGLRPTGDASDAAARTTVRNALAQYGVLCLRCDAPLDEKTFRQVAAMFGPIKDPVGRTRDGGELRYDADMQIIDAGFVLTDEMRAPLGAISFGGLDDRRPGLFETFHVDDTYTDPPAAFTVLNAQELPPSGGGDTVFLDMRAAYDLLAPEMQKRLQGLRAVYAYNNRNAFPPRVSACGLNDALEDVMHPIVRTHPVTRRRALYIDLDRATHVEGMAIDAGRALLQALQDHAEQRAPRYAHRWRAHDVLAWDNASVQHKASGDFPIGEPRRFYRFMIAGSKPI
ncbi:MAG TPA: TauD/TfdA family dioxygenase [Candidatus Margulisiibacteriota bacterium]|nr:TauD/TfdA family dioxygenase [Candidatus Margulisiibacteriota bacterium]